MILSDFKLKYPMINLSIVSALINSDVTTYNPIELNVATIAPLSMETNIAKITKK